MRVYSLPEHRHQNCVGWLVTGQSPSCWKMPPNEWDSGHRRPCVATVLGLTIHLNQYGDLILDILMLTFSNPSATGTMLIY